MDRMASDKNIQMITERRRAYYDRLRKKGDISKERILELVAIGEPQGKSAQELEKEIGCHRDTRRRNCNELIKTGMLKKIGGKRGKYHLGPRSIGNPRLAAIIFKEKTIKKFYNLGGKQLWVSNRFCNEDLCKRIVSKLREEKVVSSKDLDELFMFEYVLRIGAILTYEIIQSIRYTLRIPELSSSMKDSLIISWLDNLTEPLTFIRSFRKSPPISKRLKLETGNTREDSKLSWLELQEGRFVDLERIYKSNFPDLFEDLEKIRVNLASETYVYNGMSKGIK